MGYVKISSSSQADLKGGGGCLLVLYNAREKLYFYNQ